MQVRGARAAVKFGSTSTHPSNVSASEQAPGCTIRALLCALWAQHRLVPAGTPAPVHMRPCSPLTLTCKTRDSKPLKSRVTKLLSAKMVACRLCDGTMPSCEEKSSVAASSAAMQCTAVHQCKRYRWESANEPETNLGRQSSDVRFLS